MEVYLHWVYMGQETKCVQCMIGSKCSHEKCLVRFLHETGKMHVSLKARISVANFTCGISVAALWPALHNSHAHMLMSLFS